MSDSRSAPRYVTKERASIEVYGRAQQASAELRNISSSGAYLVWRTPHMTLKKGDLIRVTIHLDKIGKQRNFSAEVVWLKWEEPGLGAGVHFIPPQEVVDRMMTRY